MAEIKIEPKRGMGWIWVVVAVIALALIAWLLFARADTDPVTTPTTGAAIFEAALPVLT
jgi:bacteriorhodopsin